MKLLKSFNELFHKIAHARSLETGRHIPKAILLGKSEKAIIEKQIKENLTLTMDILNWKKDFILGMKIYWVEDSSLIQPVHILENEK